METQRTWSNHDNSEKEKVVGLTLLLADFNTYYTATVIKAIWYWCQDRQTD